VFYIPEYVTLLPSADSALWKKGFILHLKEVCWGTQQQQQCDGKIVGGGVGRFIMSRGGGRNG